MRRRKRPGRVGGTGGSGVLITLVRLAPGTASTLLTGSIPLAPGDLPSGGVCALYVDGVEVSANIATVGLPHGDGSARAVRVQHTRTMTNGSVVAAVLQLGTAQSLPTTYSVPTFAVMTAVTGTWQTETPVNGVVISTDTARICASGVLGVLSPRPASIPTTPTWMATFESRIDSITDQKWGAYDGALASGGYGQYDPIYQNLVRWARTGSVTAYTSALRVWGVRRSNYYAPNTFNIPYYLMHQRGVANAAVLFADDTARSQHFSQVSSALCNTGGYVWVNQNVSNSDVGDARTAAGILLGLIALIQSGDGATVVNGSAITEWLRLWTIRILGAPQWVAEAVGQKSYKSATDTSGNVGSGTPAWSNNFQNGLLCTSLAEVHDNYITDATEKANVKTRIAECMEWMYQTQYYPAGTLTAAYPSAPGAPSPFYSLASRVVTGYTSMSPEPAIDVTGHFLGATMWLAQNVNRTTWQTRGDALFDVISRSPLNGANAPYMDTALSSSISQKVCNESFIFAGRALAWRV